MLEIKSPEGLNDTSLAASFPLHTASPATSSHRLHERLQEISEDAEDSGSTARPSISSDVPSKSHITSQRQRVDRREHRPRQSERSPPPIIRVEDTQAKTPSSPPSSVSSPKKAHISQFLVRDDSGQRSVTSMSSTSTAPTSQFSNTDTPHTEKTIAADVGDVPEVSNSLVSKMAAPPPAPQPAAAPATSTISSERQRPLRGVELLTQKPPPEAELKQSSSSSNGRPLTRQPISAQTAEETSGSLKFDDELYDFTRFDLKPKVKLGPRPVAPSEKSKRPSVPAVASIPATHRPATAKKQESTRPKSQGPMNVPVFALAPPPIPDMPEYKPRPVSRGSIKSLPSHKSSAMTPDKIRLMKAVELRKKQMRKSNPQAGTFVPPPDDEVPEVPSIPQRSAERERQQEVERANQAVKEQERKQAEEEERAQQRRRQAEEEEKLHEQRRIEEEKMIQEQQRAQDHEREQAERRAMEQESRNHLDTTSKNANGGDQQASSTKKADSGISMDYEQAESDAEDGSDDGHGREAGATPTDNSEVESAPAETPKARPTFAELPQIHSPDTSHGLTMDRGTEEADAPWNGSPSMPVSPMSDSFVDPMSRSAVSIIGMENGLGIVSPPEEELTPVPTIVMADGTRPVSSREGELAGHSGKAQDQDSNSDDADSSDDELQPPAHELQTKNSDLAKRRRGFVEPLHIDPDAEYSSDDEFMQELQSATLQEARPITVSKSPINPYVPRRPSANSMASEMSVRSININRASTMPTVDFTEMQDRLSPESSNSPYKHSPSMSTPSIERMDPLAAMRRNVSSGISRRIQALAERTSRETSPQGSASIRSISPEISRDQRESTRSPPPHPSRGSSFRNLHRQSSRASYHQAQRPISGMPQRETNAVLSVQQDRATGRDSVSVSARIVRPNPVESEDTDQVDSELQQPQLVINQQRATPAQNNVPQLPALDTTSQPPPSHAEPAVTSPASARSPTETRQMHSSSRFGRHKPSLSTTGPSAEDFPPPPTHHNASQPHPPSRADSSTTSKDKETTRTSRFFKRMSNMGGSKRKSGVPQSIASSTSPASERGSLIVPSGGLSAPISSSNHREKADMPPATMLGDLNIQFPDSLVSIFSPRPLHLKADLIF